MQFCTVDSALEQRLRCCLCCNVAWTHTGPSSVLVHTKSWLNGIILTYSVMLFGTLCEHASDMRSIKYAAILCGITRTCVANVFEFVTCGEANTLCASNVRRS